MAIYPHDNSTDTRWGRGELQVMIKAPNSDRPFGYCDGTQEDEDQLVELAEQEGLTEVDIQKKYLKTGREIWTISGEAF